MRDGEKLKKALVREAFGLLLELRSREEAPKLLREAVAFLRMLESQEQTSAVPFVVSVQLMRLRKY